MSVLTPFINFGQVLGQKAVESLTNVRGISTPNPRPISTSGDSFDFGAGVKKLLSPITSYFDPRTQAGGKVIEAAGNVGVGLFDALGRNLNDKIDQLFGNSNKKNEEVTTNVTDNRFTYPSQQLDLGSVLAAIGQANAANPQTSAETAPSPTGGNGSLPTGLLIAGAFVALGAVLIISRK